MPPGVEHIARGLDEIGRSGLISVPMPSGVEHKPSEQRELLRALLISVPMPSGVEHPRVREVIAEARGRASCVIT